jgi:predicted outer membrane repeat protein
MRGSASVHENWAYNGGGIYVSNGTLEMADYSTVSGNTTNSTVAISIACRGGGVFVSGGIFNMTGNARVAGNKAEGKKRGATAYNRSADGGGVYLTVFNHPQSSGLQPRAAELTMSENSSVSGNTAKGNGASGGGIYIKHKGTLTMKGNASVSGNTATSMDTSSAFG